MKTVAIVAVLLLLPVIARAQTNTIELTNGQVLEWQSLRDKGENLEVQTASETKIVKKSEIKKILAVPPKTTLAVDPKSSINLLAKINPEKDATSGNWRLSPKGLSVETPNAQAKLVFPIDVPDEYELSIVLERRGDSDWGGDFCFGLVGGGRQFVAVIDADEGAHSGFELINGEGVRSNGTAKGGLLFPRNQGPRLLSIVVTRIILSMSVDGKLIASTSAEYEKMSVSKNRSITEKNRLFLVSSKWGTKFPPSTWTISKMVLTPKGVELTPPK